MSYQVVPKSKGKYRGGRNLSQRYWGEEGLGGAEHPLPGRCEPYKKKESAWILKFSAAI